MYAYFHRSPYLLLSLALVPCAPEGVNVTVGCATGTVSVQWLPSVGALTYTATLEPLVGVASCCSTLNNITSCEVRSLPCGQSYMLTVTAAGRNCNSSQSTAIMVQTGNTLTQTSALLLSHSTTFYALEY